MTSILWIFFSDIVKFYPIISLAETRTFFLLSVFLSPLLYNLKVFIAPKLKLSFSALKSSLPNFSKQAPQWQRKK